jgi:hypothetical protein
MPVISRKAFAELCGDTELKINVWISRGKINITPESKKLIDTEDPKNVDFVAEREIANAVKEISKDDTKVSKNVSKTAKTDTKISKKVTKPTTKAPVKPEKKVVKAAKVAAPAPETLPNAAIYAQSQARLDLDTRAKEQQMELKALHIQSEKIRLDKTAGNLLPIDLAAGVIERHANSILKTFEKGFERIAEIYANMAGFDPKARAEFLKECREELAQCVDKAGEKSQEEIDILIDNYS